jgi:2,4-dienoyl-CoA reductase-like NADH-dependent reductase (Old Yellow Enzyme family)/thioredoxin reductase
MKYQKLFSPLKVGRLTLKNRIVTAPMSIVELDAKGGYTEACFAFYENLAAGGAAAVTLGESIVGTANGMTHPQQINFDNSAVGYYLRKMADVVHAQGAFLNIELSHGGALSDPEFNNGTPTMGPSAMTDDWGDTIREMTREDMDEVKEAFCRAAVLCKACGLDMVMIHAGHGWLLHQFLSPKYNRRTDEYGGSRENRARYPLEVVKAVREAVGRDFVLDLRISGDEFTEGGSTIEDCVYFCSQAQDYVDMMNVSAGQPWGKRMAISVFEERGINSEFSAAVKKVVTKCPVSSVGGYTDPALMERFLEEGRCDYFLLGRSILADPQLPDKARTGRCGEIHQCLRCFICNDAQYHEPGRLLRCSVNPTAGREARFRFALPPAEKRKVIVVGGGPGGMSAAIAAAKRGHQVILCEKGDELGGWLRMEKHLYFKSDMVKYVDTLAYECELNGVEIRRNTPVTREYLENEGADFVIAALGSRPFAPPIPGRELPNVCFAVDCFRPPVELGQKIVVIGGGSIGCEVGLELGHEGRDVSIIEMRDDVFVDAAADYRRFILPHIEKYTKTFCGLTVAEIRPDGVLAKTAEGEERFFPADNVLMAAGLKAKEDEAEALRSDAYELVVIGDARKPGKVVEAVRQGFDAGTFLR